MPVSEEAQKVYVVNNKPIPVYDFGLLVATGRAPGVTAFNKFGRNPSVGTTVAPVSNTGLYPTPTALTSLELVSSSTGDTATGPGAQQVTIIGIGTNWAEVSEVVTMNGTGAAAISTQFYRVYRFYVSRSGTYASSSAGSHLGTLTLREAGGGSTWFTVGLVDSLGRGQTQIASYTVPANKVLYVYSFDFSVDATKSVNVYLFQRQNADDVTTPFDAMRVVRQYDGVMGFGHINLPVPLKFMAKTDVGFMAETAVSTASLSIQFDGFLVDA